MRYVCGWLVLAMLLLSMSVVSSPRRAVAADDKPITMSEVGRLVDAGISPRAVMEAMVKRGVGFRVTSAAEKRLAKWGFSEHQIKLIEKIAAGETVDLDAAPAAGGDGDAAGEDGGDYPVGYPNEAGWHVAEQRRIERAVEASHIGYKRIELERVTLYCTDARARQLVPMLRKLEAELIEKFPDSIANAAKPASAHIVIIDGESNWANWVDACFDTYEQDGMRYRFGPDEEDPRPMNIKGHGYMLPWVTNTHADKLPNDEAVARYAAFSVGYLIMGQAAGKKYPDGLRTGFGDLTEAMAFKTPSVMISSYTKRDLGRTENTWKALVAERFKGGKIKDVTDPWVYETSTMAIEHYAECWSLVSTLCEAPDKFAAAVEMVRKQEKTMAEAVREAYGLDDKKLLEAWRRWVGR